MTAQVTTASLRDRVRDRVVQPNTSGFVSDTQLDRLVSEGAYEFYDLLIKARAADYVSKIHAFNTASSLREYPLPLDFYRLTSISISETAGTPDPFGSSPGSAVTAPTDAYWYEPERFQAARLAERESVTPARPLDLHYAITGTFDYSLGVGRDLIRFHPAPRATWCVQIVYLPVLDLSGEAPGLNGVNGWESYIVAHVAATVAGMQEDDPGLWLAQKAEIKDRVIGLAGDRDAARPMQVQDRRFGAYRRGRRYPWP